MNIRDRVKQAATASSDVDYIIVDGTAPDGFRTFRDGFRVPTIAALGGSVTWSHVPALVETAGGDWQIITGTLGRVDDTTLALTLGTFHESSTGSPLGLTGDAPVTLTVIGTALSYHAMALQALPYSGSFPGVPAGGASTTPYVNGDGLMAVGAGSFSSRKHSVAMGNNAWAPAQAMDVYGFGFSQFPLSGVTLEHLKGKAVLRNAYTTDATQAGLDLTDSDGTIAGAGWFTCEPGFNRLRGRVYAIDTASGDHKIWDVDLLIKTALDYSTTVAVGTPVFTVFDASAGAASWALDHEIDGQDYRLRVTGEAATNIVWTFTGDYDHTVVYV